MILSRKTMYYKGCYWPELNNLFINILNNMSDINADGTVETPTIEELQAKLVKAEWKIVEMKKTSKETKVVETPKTETTDTPNFMTREDFEQEKFFEQNPWLVEHKESISEKVSKGYTLEDAKTVLLSQDKTIEARKNTQNSNFTTWTPDFNKSSYTIEDLEKLPQWEYNKIMELKKQGKVTITK